MKNIGEITFGPIGFGNQKVVDSLEYINLKEIMVIK